MGDDEKEMRGDEELGTSVTDGLVSDDKELAPPLQTRICYAMFLLVSFVLCLIVKDGLSGALDWLPVKNSCKVEVHHSPAPHSLLSGVKDNVLDSVSDSVTHSISKLCTGHAMVFRFSFTCAVFYLLHVMFQAREVCCVSDEQKNEFQSGFFCIKTVVFVLLLIVSIFLPSGLFEVYGKICLFASGIFLIIQVILLIDFVYEWNDSWANKAEDEGRWGVYLVLLTGLFYAAAMVLIILMYVWFTQGDSCDLHGFYITATLITGILYTALSVKMPHGSIFVSSMVFLYSAVLCFSAIKNGDNSKCNSLNSDHATGVTWSLVLSSLAVGVSVAWASASAGSSRSALSLSDHSDETDDVKQSRNYMFFHLIMMLGAMYMAMLFTNWGTVGEKEEHTSVAIASGTTAMWVKMISQWLAVAAYVWSLVAPLVLKDRDFTHAFDV